MFSRFDAKLLNCKIKYSHKIRNLQYYDIHFWSIKLKINTKIYHFILNRETWLPRFAIDQNSCLFDWGEYPVKKQTSCLELIVHVLNLQSVKHSELSNPFFRIFLRRKILTSFLSDMSGIWWTQKSLNFRYWFIKLHFCNMCIVFG